VPLRRVVLVLRLAASHYMTPPDCPSRIATACTCRAWCHAQTALDRLDPHPGRSWQQLAQPEGEA
jgi:hypothetical protein